MMGGSKKIDGERGMEGRNRQRWRKKFPIMKIKEQYSTFLFLSL
jgi:hypothetical protein